MTPTTMQRERTTERCPECFGGSGPCARCFGFGWVWSDGKPPTICPGGGARPYVSRPELLPCGRGSRLCPGCDRPSLEIGDDDDRARTTAWREAHERRRR